MPKRNKGSRRAPKREYCRGYIDEHGQWNNGFYCPQWGGPDRKYCCGTETHRFCCPKEQPVLEHTWTLLDHLPLILGIVAGVVVILIITLLMVCYFCQCCWVYRRRKRSQNGGSTCGTQLPPGGRSPDYAVSYSVCPHPPYLHDGLGHSVCYPLDDPPPYPGDGLQPLDEKQPLNPSHLYVAMETPDELLLGGDRRENAAVQGASDNESDTMGTTPRTESVSPPGDNGPMLGASGEVLDDGTAETGAESPRESSEAADLRLGNELRAPPRGTHRTHELLMTALGCGASSSEARPGYTMLQDEEEEDEEEEEEEHRVTQRSGQEEKASGGAGRNSVHQEGQAGLQDSDRHDADTTQGACACACEDFSTSPIATHGGFLEHGDRTLSIEHDHKVIRDIIDDVDDDEDDDHDENRRGSGAESRGLLATSNDKASSEDGATKTTSYPAESVTSLGEDCTVQVIPQG